jgi:diaminobutyrate-2-oxoglutarate transaminase
MIGVELVDADSAAPDALVPPPSPRLAAAVQQECLHRGLIVELGGRHAGVVRLLPPLTLTDEQAVAVLDRFADALAAAERSTQRRTDNRQSH